MLCLCYRTYTDYFYVNYYIPLPYIMFIRAKSRSPHVENIFNFADVVVQ